MRFLLVLIGLIFYSFNRCIKELFFFSNFEPKVHLLKTLQAFLFHVCQVETFMNKLSILYFTGKDSTVLTGLEVAESMPSYRASQTIGNFCLLLLNPKFQI